MFPWGSPRKLLPREFVVCLPCSPAVVLLYQRGTACGTVDLFLTLALPDLAIVPLPSCPALPGLS